MDYLKKLSNTTKKYLKKKRNVVFIFLFVLFYSFKPFETLAFILTLPFVAFGYTFYKEELFKKELNNFLKTIFISLIGLLTISSFSTPRKYSWDGLLWYFKRILLLQDNFFLEFTNSAHTPYFMELLLAAIAKLTNINFVYLSLFIFSILNIFLLYEFYLKLGFEKPKSKFLTFLFITSPISLNIAFNEVKVEHFLLNLTLVSLIYYLKFFKSNKFKHALVFSLFAGLAFLAKISIVPFYIFLLIYLGVKKFNRGIRSRMQLVILGVVFIAPITFWTLRYGIHIPWTGIEYYPRGYSPSVVFEKDVEIYKQCLAEQKQVDFNHLLNKHGLLAKNFHPLAMIQNIGIPFDLAILLYPGFIIYFSILFFIPRFLTIKKYLKSPIYLSTTLFLIYYFLFIKTAYWYVFIIFPVVLIPFYEYFIEKNQINKIIVTTIAVSFFILYANSIYAFFPRYIPDNSGSIFVESNFKYSNYLNKTQGMILDATPHPEQVFLTFVYDYDTRVVRDSLYFGYTQKNDKELYEELRFNGIKYIAIKTPTVKGVELFGCPFRHTIRGYKFLRVYGVPVVYNTGNNSVLYWLK